MKIRIIKMKNYSTLHELELGRWWGWEKLMYGSEGNCREALKRYKEHGTVELVVHEETI